MDYRQERNEKRNALKKGYSKNYYIFVDKKTIHNKREK